MFEHTTQIRVRYGETDQMGYVYYGNYALYYEQGRTEAVKALGISYKQLEEMGYMLPVAELKIRYKQPAVYDDLLTIRSVIAEMPGRSMTFDTEITNEAGVLLNQGTTKLLFTHADSRKICTAPDSLIELLKPYFR